MRPAPRRCAAALGRLAVTLALSGVVGCASAPRYAPPSAPVPSTYGEASGHAEWKAAEPRDTVPRGNWWEVFGDPRLNALEAQLLVSSQTLKIAEARFRQARALVRADRAGLFPTVSAGGSASRARVSGNRPGGTGEAATGTDLQLSADVSYEADVWGRVRRAVDARRADAQASAADLEAVRLELAAELAVDYFQLRSLRAEQKLLETTANGYVKALELTQNRYHGGVASQIDVAQAETQLQSTRAEAIDVQVQSAQLQHAIATLVGDTAVGPAWPEDEASAAVPPAVPVGLPSDLLERRPDVAAAERRVAAASARIGVARAAYFPALVLGGSVGAESQTVSTLLSGPSALWAVAGSVLGTIFDGGRRRAGSEQARAAYDEAVAAYRQTVLASIQEVEDALAELRILEDEARAQDAAVAAARRSLELSTSRYKGGIVTYLEVITAQSATLNGERRAVDIERRRTTASVLLVKALGGGWTRS